MARILVIDPDPQVRRFLAVSLGAGGHKVVEADHGRAGLDALQGHRADLVILDLDLPDQDGQDTVSAVRSIIAAPIVVLTARSDEAQKVEALDRGANDYVQKPFGIGELLARIRAALRPSQDRVKAGIVTSGAVQIDMVRRMVLRDGQQVHLTKREFELLRVLATHPDHVLAHQRIARAAWGATRSDDTARLRVYVNQLRQKLEADPAMPRIIVTEPGIGYRLRTFRHER